MASGPSPSHPADTESAVIVAERREVETEDQPRLASWVRGGVGLLTIQVQL